MTNNEAFRLGGNIEIPQFEQWVKDYAIYRKHRGARAVCHCGAEYRFNDDLYDVTDANALTDALSVDCKGRIKRWCPQCLDVKNPNFETAWKTRKDIVEHELNIDGRVFRCIYLPAGKKIRKIKKTFEGYVEWDIKFHTQDWSSPRDLPKNLPPVKRREKELHEIDCLANVAPATNWLE